MNKRTAAAVPIVRHWRIEVSERSDLVFSLRDYFRRLGLSAEQLGGALENALLGARVGSIRRYDHLVGVRVRYPDPVRFDADRIAAMPLSVAGKTRGEFTDILIERGM